MANYLRAFRAPQGQADEGGGEDGTLLFVASTGGVKRDGLDLDQDRWLLENYRLNPVVLWAHDYWGGKLPVGRAETVEVVEGELRARVSFDPDDAFAQEVRRKYEKGYLNAVSVGWNEVDEDGKVLGWEEADKAARNGELWYELLDIAAVAVPGDPEALMERTRRGWEDLVDWVRSIEPEQGGSRSAPTGVAAPHSTARVGEDVEWDGAAEVGKAWAQPKLLWRMHAWRDGAMDPEMKEAYQLPHHLASGEVVWSGVAAAMADLLQAATQIPESDRRGVYNHLERHYSQFGKEAPEFRTAAELALLRPDQVAGLFLEGEMEGGEGGSRTGGSRSAPTGGGMVTTREGVAALKGAYELLGKVIAEVDGEVPPQVDEGDEALDWLFAILDKIPEKVEESDDE